MDHAEVLARLEAAATGAGKIAALEGDRSPVGVELLRHLESCDACRAELEAWRLVDAALAVATPDTVAASPEARSRVLAAVLTQGVARGPGAAVPPPIRLAPGAHPGLEAGVTEGPAGDVDAPTSAYPVAATSVTGASAGGTSGMRRLRPGAGSRATGAPGSGAPAAEPRTIGFRWLALAAAALVLVFALGAILGGPLGLIQQADPNERLERILAEASEILSRPGHVTAALETADGEPGGFVAMSPGTGRMVVVARDLEPVADGERYRCWIERDGVRSEVGPLNPVGDRWFWAGPVEEPVDAGSEGDEFLVIPEGSDEPVLYGTF
jgi:hypothetical protein